MFSQRFMLRLAATLIVSALGWLMMWGFGPGADPRLGQAQALIDSGEIYQMTEPELEKRFGRPSDYHLHPTWDADFALDDNGIIQGKWLVVHLEDQKVTEAKVVSN